MKGRKSKTIIISIIVILFSNLTFIEKSSCKNIILNDRNILTRPEILDCTLDGEILYVGGSGPGNYSYIGAAIDDAEDGDIIYVYNGTYHESLKIFKEIELIGENNKTTIIDTWGSGPSFSIDSNNVKIKCFNIQNSNSKIIEIKNNDNLTLLNNIIIYDMDYFGGCEIYLENSSNNKIVNNYLTKTSFYIKESYNNTIDCNLINEKPLVYLEEASNKIINEAGQVILIKCNNITINYLNLSNVRVGIQLEKCNDCCISNNFFNHSYYGGIEILLSNNILIEGNNFSEDNINLDSSNDNIIINNIFYNFYDNTFRLSDNNIIKNNKMISNHYGLKFYYSNHNLVEENIFLKNNYGFYQVYSNNNTVINNFFKDNDYAINIEKGFNDYISNNIITCNYKGMTLSSCSNDIIIENNCIDNIYGISLSSGKNNTIINNSFKNDGLFVTSPHNNIYNNTINSKPIIYLENIENKVITGNIGQLILIECEFITINNMVITNTSYGIQLINSNNCNINDNILYYNYNGVYCYRSDNNTMRSNNFSFNVIGINFRYSNNNRILGNICLNNNNEYYSHPLSSYNYYRSGISLYYSDNNYIEGNDCSENYVGIYIQSFSDNNSVEKNIIKHCNYSIKLRTSSNDNLIYRNHLENNIVGITLDEVSYNMIIKNNFIKINKEMDLNIGVYYSWHRPVDINENYWDKPMFFPKILIGELTYVYADVPWGGWMHFPIWFYIDWHPAKIPNSYRCIK